MIVSPYRVKNLMKSGGKYARSIYLFIAIISEVIETSLLKMFEGFSKLYPTLAIAFA